MTLGLLAWNLMMYADGCDELEDWDKDTYWHTHAGDNSGAFLPSI